MIKNLDKIGVDFVSGLAPLQRSRDEEGEGKSENFHIEVNLWPWVSLGESLGRMVCCWRVVWFGVRLQKDE